MLWFYLGEIDHLAFPFKSLPVRIFLRNFGREMKGYKWFEKSKVMIFNQLQADSVDHNFKWLTYNNWEIFKKCNSIYWKLEYSINQSKIYMRFIQSTGRPKSIDILTYI